MQSLLNILLEGIGWPTTFCKGQLKWIVSPFLAFPASINTGFFLEKHGISRRFLDYFQSLDKTIGERALGQQQTVSGKVHATVEQATKQARAVDEQRGFSKIANDVRLHSVTPLPSHWTLRDSITRKPFPLHGDRKSGLSTQRAPSRWKISTRKLDASQNKTSLKPRRPVRLSILPRLRPLKRLSDSELLYTGKFHCDSHRLLSDLVK